MVFKTTAIDHSAIPPRRTSARLPFYRPWRFGTIFPLDPISAGHVSLRRRARNRNRPERGQSGWLGKAADAYREGGDAGPVDGFGSLADRLRSAFEPRKRLGRCGAAGRERSNCPRSWTASTTASSARLHRLARSPVYRRDRWAHSVQERPRSVWLFDSRTRGQTRADAPAPVRSGWPDGCAINRWRPPADADTRGAGSRRLRAIGGGRCTTAGRGASCRSRASG